MFRVFPDTAACALLRSLSITTSSASALGREPRAAPGRILLPPQTLLCIALLSASHTVKGPVVLTASEFVCAFTVLPLGKTVTIGLDLKCFSKCLFIYKLCLLES